MNLILAAILVVILNFSKPSMMSAPLRVQTESCPLINQQKNYYIRDTYYIDKDHFKNKHYFGGHFGGHLDFLKGLNEVSVFSFITFNSITALSQQNQH